MQDPAQNEGRQMSEEANESTENTAKKASSPGKTIEGRPLEVVVDQPGLERAIRKLGRKMANEGIVRELKRRRHYEKPSVRKRRKAREAERRRRRNERRISRRVA